MRLFRLTLLALVIFSCEKVEEEPRKKEQTKEPTVEQQEPSIFEGVWEGSICGQTIVITIQDSILAGYLPIEIYGNTFTTPEENASHHRGTVKGDTMSYCQVAKGQGQTASCCGTLIKR